MCVRLTPLPYLVYQVVPRRAHSWARACVPATSKAAKGDFFLKGHQQKASHFWRVRDRKPGYMGPHPGHCPLRVFVVLYVSNSPPSRSCPVCFACVTSSACPEINAGGQQCARTIELSVLSGVVSLSDLLSPGLSFQSQCFQLPPCRSSSGSHSLFSPGEQARELCRSLLVQELQGRVLRERLYCGVLCVCQLVSCVTCVLESGSLGVPGTLACVSA